MTASSKDNKNIKICPNCKEDIEPGVSQKEHNATCPYHPCLECEDENSKQCLTCPDAK